MKMSSKCVLLGLENKVSAKGTVYTLGLVQSGAETASCRVLKQDLNGIEFYKEYIVDFDYSPRWGKIDIVDIRKVS